MPVCACKFNYLRRFQPFGKFFCPFPIYPPPIYTSPYHNTYIIYNREFRFCIIFKGDNEGILTRCGCPKKKHKASCKKYKPCILKYKALISKYMPYIFYEKSHLIFNDLQRLVFKASGTLRMRHEIKVRACFPGHINNVVHVQASAFFHSRKFSSHVASYTAASASSIRETHY